MLHIQQEGRNTRASNASRQDMLIHLNRDFVNLKRKCLSVEKTNRVKVDVEVRVKEVLEKIYDLRAKNKMDEETINEFESDSERIIDELRGTSKDLMNDYKTLNSKIMELFREKEVTRKGISKKYS